MKSENIVVRITPEKKRRLAKRAKANKLTISSLVDALINEELNEKDAITTIYKRMDDKFTVLSERFNQIDTKFSALYGVWLTLRFILQKALIMVERDAHARQTGEKLSKSKLNELESTIEAETETLHSVEKELEEWEKGMKKRPLNE